MTTIILKNKELAPTINFLQGLPLKNTDSRHRSKFVNLLTGPLEELQKEENVLMEQAELLDADGVLLPAEQQSDAQVKAFRVEQNALLEEEVVISGGMYAKNICEIPRILSEYEGELAGQDAEVYNRLLDEFEKEVAE